MFVTYGGTVLLYYHYIFVFDPEPEGHRFVSPRLLCVTLVKQSWFIYLFYLPVYWDMSYMYMQLWTIIFFYKPEVLSCA